MIADINYSRMNATWLQLSYRLSPPTRSLPMSKPTSGQSVTNNLRNALRLRPLDFKSLATICSRRILGSVTAGLHVVVVVFNSEERGVLRIIKI